MMQRFRGGMSMIWNLILILMLLRMLELLSPVSTAGAAVTKPVSTGCTAGPTKRVSTADDITIAETLVYIRKSAAKDKDIQARVEADEELAQRLQAEEREMYTKAEQARMLVELINQRKKHMGSHALQQLRGYSFAETKTLFETTMRRVNTFVPIESEVDRAVPELAAGSLKRDAEEELGQESSKRQNVTPLPKG
ncbi:hypothetical protein Tco_0149758 [Tanacetum coccineum]